MRKRTELSRAVTCILMIGLSAYSEALLAANSGGSGVEYNTDGNVYVFYAGVAGSDVGSVSGGNIVVDPSDSDRYSSYVGGMVFGSSLAEVALIDNHTVIDGGDFREDHYSFAGAYASGIAGTTELSMNTLTVNGGLFGSEDIFAGAYVDDAENALVSSNKVSVADLVSSFSDAEIYGGYALAKKSAEVNYNKIEIFNAQFNEGQSWYVVNAVGGSAKAKEVAKTAHNQVKVSGTQFNLSAEICAGESWAENNAEATGNTVTITNIKVIDNGSDWVDVYGGYAKAGSAVASNNQVSISESNLGDWSYIFGGYAEGVESAIATDNAVHIINLASDEDFLVIGGEANLYSNEIVAHTLISDSTVSVLASFDNEDSIGFDQISTQAKNNRVYLSQVKFKNSTVVGGYADGDSNTFSQANDNIIEINGGSITNSWIAGGQVIGQGEASNNLIILRNSPKLDGTSLVGGYIDYGWEPVFLNFGAIHTRVDNILLGNTLEIHGVGITAAQVINFQTYRFILPNAIEDGSSVLTLESNNPTEISNADIQIAVEDGSRILSSGTQVTLLANEQGMSAQNLPTNVQASQGSTIVYDFELATNSVSSEVRSDLVESVVATVRGAGAKPQAKSLSEGWLAGMALIRQGADLAVAEAMRTIQEMGRLEYATFGAILGGTSRYDTNSHIDLDSVVLTAGAVVGNELEVGRLSIGAFLEYGNGFYDTHNTFSGMASVDGDGDAWYAGIGVLGRMDFNGSDKAHFYTEGSARIGQLHNDFNSADFRDISGVIAKYDDSVTYYGMHIGFGYELHVTHRVDVDFYGKYFWTHQQSEDTGLSTSEDLHFDSIDSSRVRLGAEVKQAVSEHVLWRAGLAYEYEFDGKAGSKTNGLRISDPSLEGSSGIAQLQVQVKPSASKPLEINLGVQGYVGQREGISGSASMVYRF